MVPEPCMHGFLDDMAVAKRRCDSPALSPSLALLSCAESLDPRTHALLLLLGVHAVLSIYHHNRIAL